MSKKSATKRKKSVETRLSDEVLELITVTDEYTQKSLDRLKYTIHEPPFDQKIPRGKMWCSYCNNYNKFRINKNSKSSYERCESCNISVEDWYIKKHNGLWKLK